MKLAWTEHRPPGLDCRYDNCSAETPFGVYRIEWKSWKDYPGYTIEFQGEEGGRWRIRWQDGRVYEELVAEVVWHVNEEITAES